MAEIRAGLLAGSLSKIGFKLKPRTPAED
jgi:hypothetical protein